MLDSRGNPTLKVVVKSQNYSGYAIVPSGASTGRHEALELRDFKKPYFGMGVELAVGSVNKEISKELLGLSLEEQHRIDGTLIELDGTANKSRLGANALIGVSMAACRAAAASKHVELYEHIARLHGLDLKGRISLPVPLANVINGGLHAGNQLKFQEFMLIPRRAASFEEAARAVSETYHSLKRILSEKYTKNATAVGDEGGFAPPLKSGQEALALLQEAIHKAGYTRMMAVGLDAAATTFYTEGKYDLGTSYSPSELSRYYAQLVENYNLRSLEDPFAEDDIASWARLMQDFARKRKIQVVGDDLTVTSEARVRMAAGKNLCNAMILKPNQVGTLTESLSAAKACKASGWEVIVSHRSADSEDSFIADLAVGIGASQIKLGAPCRSERTAKYNRLLEIESMARKRDYAGKKLRF